MNVSHNGKGKKDTAPLSELAGVGALVVGLISAWLYAAGWTYAYHFFDRFGIPLLMVDIPRENYFVYGWIVVQQFSIWTLSIFLVLIAVIALWRWSRLGADRFVTQLGIVVALAGAFWVGHWAAVAAAQEQYLRQRKSDYSAFPRVQVWQKEDPQSEGGSRTSSSELASGCYRLLLHNKERLFLLRPFKNAPAASLPVLISPWDQIAFLRVLPEYTSCE